MENGNRVRIKTAPDRIGILVGPPKVTGNRVRWLVQFPGRSQRLPETLLELVEDDESIEDLLAAGNYGRANNLRGSIMHARLTGRLADVVYSMESTNTDYYAYQFKPVLNFLKSPSNGILIADEVGLGKTIEAGLIWTELRARYDARRLLVICPAHLCEKWIKELKLRFGIRADRVDAGELLARLKNSSGPMNSFVAVASLQSLRPPKNWDSEDNQRKSALLARYLDEIAVDKEAFDCVIIDEAHYMRNPKSQSNALGHLVRETAKNVILLSATPIQLRSEDLFHLLNIIDKENFEFKSAFDTVLDANRPIMALSALLRRSTCSADALRDNLRECLANGLLSSNRQLLDLFRNMPTERQLKEVDFRARLANRMERVNLLGSVLNRTLKRDVRERKVVRKPIALQIEMTDIERKFYDAVTDRVRAYCSNYGMFEGFLLTIPQRQMCSSMAASIRAWKRAEYSYDDEDLSVVEIESDGQISLKKETLNRKSGPLISELAALGESFGSYDELKSNDSKYAMLLKETTHYWLKHPKKKIILFSFYRETLKYLEERLAEDGVSSILVMGGMAESKESLVQKFQDDDSIKILLSSEVLSEGVDLQFSSTLINYDLPWNPMKVEQRIGRIDRIGQKEESILIWNLFYEDTLDDRIYRRLFERLGIFERAFGVYEAVLGNQLRELQHRLLTHDLTEEEEQQQIDQARMALATEKENQEELESQAASLVAHGDYVLNEVVAAKEMGRYIDGESLFIYVRDYVKRNHPGTVLETISHDPLTVNIELDSNLKVELGAYIETTSAINLTKLATAPFGNPVRCVFKNNVDAGNQRREIINHHHPLVRYIAAHTKSVDFHQTIAVTLDKTKNHELSPGVFMIAVKHWETTGAKTTERIVYRGVNIASGELIDDMFAEKIIMSALTIGEDWMGAQAHINKASVLDLHSKIEHALDDSFEQYCHEMELENTDNIERLTTTLSSQINRQIQTKKASIETLRLKGNDRMARLFEGQIKRLNEKRDMRSYSYQQKKNIKSEPKDLFLGVFNIR